MTTTNTLRPHSDPDIEAILTDRDNLRAEHAAGAIERSLLAQANTELIAERATLRARCEVLERALQAVIEYMDRLDAIDIDSILPKATDPRASVSLGGEDATGGGK